LEEHEKKFSERMKQGVKKLTPANAEKRQAFLIHCISKQYERDGKVAYNVTGRETSGLFVFSYFGKRGSL
jgi:hypothetical protein